MENKKIENSCLTVSEIAEKADVTRNKVWTFIRKNKIEPVKKYGKSYKFDSSIVSEIIEKQNKKQVKPENKETNNISADVLKIFQKQLEIKDKQIAEQQETIDYFRNENIQLRLEKSKQQKLLEDQNAKLNAISKNDLETDKETRHWWQFGRKFN